MGLARRWARRALGLLALFGAGIAAPAAAPVGDGWVADPDSQFLLDVTIRNLSLGDGVRAYSTPDGTCVVFGDFLAALDVPMKIDLEAHRASGWAFRQENRVEIDQAKSQAVVSGKRESFAKDAIRETPEGWCVAAETLGRWFGLGIAADTGASQLRLESEAKLPVEMAIDRRNRARGLKRAAALPLENLPAVRLPYRMWRAPVLEFVVNAGVTYSAGGGVKVDRSASVQAAGEIAAMSYLASISADGQGAIRSAWARLYRSDPDGGLLGPLQATHFAIGDVPGRAGAFGGSSDSGRGAVVTNRPLTMPTAFDRTDLTGELADGWDAELYRNGSLVGFQDSSDGDGRYHFADVDLLYGDNDFEVVLYGPQGQQVSRHETVNVGRDHVPPGKFWYWAGVRQPGQELFGTRSASTDTSGLPVTARSSVAPELTLEAQYGVDERMSVGALVRSAMIEDERVTFVEGSVRRSVGPALVEIGGAVDQQGRFAARAQLVGKLGPATISAGTYRSNGLSASGDSGRAEKAQHRLGVGVPVKLGKTTLPLSADVRLTDFLDGAREVAAAGRLSARIGRFNLGSETQYRVRRSGDGPEQRDASTRLIGSARVGAVRLRGTADWNIAPEARFAGADMTAYWSKSDTADWEAGVAYRATEGRVRGHVTHVRRLRSLSMAVTGEAASDGSLAAGVSLSFALDPSRTGLRPTSDKLASNGIVHARVFEDLNENGRRDRDEPYAANALVTAGLRVADRETDRKGEVTLGNLAPYVPLAIGIDQTSLDNPALTPLKPAQLVIPRPGVSAEVEIALVGGGAIEGFAVKADGSEFEGVDLELVDERGLLIATARSDLDGYFLFEGIRYGRYQLRLSAVSAAAIDAPAALSATATIDREHPLARLGPVPIRPRPNIAVAEKVAAQ